MRVRSVLALAVFASFVASPARAGLPEYIQKPEPDYAWKLEKKDELANGTVYTIHLVSQTWQGNKWEHKLLVLQPKNVKPNATMLLMNTGGNPGGAMQLVGLELTRRIGSPIAILFGVPNQPLFGNLKEDALIAETFVRYLDAGGKDESWPLLFPMVKGVVKSMDALQAFAKQEWQHEIQDFVVSGASKRGWTAWLTAAADPRVKALVPMVIDTLNMKPQMEHQVASFGKPSDQVHDYVERGLIPMPDTAIAKRLWSIVDPYFYRDKYTMPKLIINGANDPYWTVDALNFYWKDLPGDKYVCIVPNAGHDLQEVPPTGKLDPITARARVLNATSAFVRHQTTGKPLPKLQWKHDTTPDGKLRLNVASSIAPSGTRLWVAESKTRDFRKSRWKDHPAALSSEGKVITGMLAGPTTGFLALYGEMDFEIDGLKYSLSTQVQVVGAQ